VLKDGKEVFRCKAESDPVSHTIKRFLEVDGSWVLEYENHVVIDGTDLGRKNGYDAVFGYRTVAGKPFYFFERNGRTRMAYRGRPLPYVYDEVVHYKCCEPATFNPGSSKNMVWFHARKAGYWYYVEAGVFVPTESQPASVDSRRTTR